MNSNRVSLIRVRKAIYPTQIPFNPDEPYPEYPFGDKHILSERNYCYEGIRKALFLMGLDEGNFGTPYWNPLGELINPGEKVVLKPNFVMHENRSGYTINSVITNGSIIRAILDYVIIALKGRGEIFIVDAPQYDADFEKIIELSGTKYVVEALQKRTNIPITLADLRVEQAIEQDGLVVGRKKLNGDPNGYVPMDLGKKSFFNALELKKSNIRGSDYDGIETIQHHNKNKHEYLISKTVLNSDVFINIPKLKTHRKTGVTLCLKNLIGINGDKNWIPHYRIGGPLKEGDEHSSCSKLRDLECMIKDKFKTFVYHSGPCGLYVSRKIRKTQKVIVERSHFFDIRGGSWYGNDTLWRSILDLNRILFFADKNGTLHQKRQRKYLSIIDGIIAGEGDGPYHTSPVSTGCILAATDPIALDLAAIQFIGFDYRKIPKVFHALNDKGLTPDFPINIDFCSNSNEWKDLLLNGRACFNFKPPFSWQGHIEMDSSDKQSLQET